MATNPLSYLSSIRTKVRRLTRSPAEAQLPTATLDDYINTFILYDFPEHLRLFDLRTTFTFYAEPYKDVYETNTTVTTSPLYNFKQRYMSVHEPVYVAGYHTFYTQSREQLFNIYPQVNNIQSIGTVGDGITTFYSGTLSAVPIVAGNVLFSSVDISNQGLALIDVPRDPFDGIGDLIIPNNPFSLGTINYVTGAYSFSFSSAPAPGVAINSQTIPYSPSIPQAICFYDDKFILRPIPDQPYRINMEVYIRPTELLDAGQSPEIEQWWQYISYGAAIKILQDRLDLDTVNLLMPEYKNQERLVLRKTIVINTNERVATIYTDNILGPNSYGWWYGNGNF